MKRFLLLLHLVILLTACSAPLDAPQTTPKQNTITFQTTPALAHWLPSVAACADALPGVSVVSHIHPLETLFVENADLTLRLGSQKDSDPYTAVMGIEKLVVFTDNALPIDSLSLESIQKLFSGEVSQWQAIPEIESNHPGFSQPVTIWSYPPGHELRSAYEQSYLQGENLSAQAIPFSTIEGLITKMNQQPYGIGYSLEQHLTGIDADIQTIDIEDGDPALGTLYVLAVTQEEPQNELRQILLCLQNAQ